MLQYYSVVGPAIVQVAQIGARRCPEPLPPDQVILRLQPMHDSWVAYMAALGQLADDKPIQRVSADAKQVTDGLTAVQKARPNLGITSGEINLVGGLVKLLEDAVVRKMRQDALDEIITKGQPGFQAAMALESRAIRRAYIPDLDNYRSEFDTLSGLLRHSFGVHLTDVRAASGILPAEQATLQQGCLSNEVIIGQVLMPTEISTRRSAAEAYASALDKLAAAHTKLFESRDQVLTRATYDQIKPLVDEAKQAWTDFRKLR